jgi:hypothetical protein
MSNGSQVSSVSLSNGYRGQFPGAKAQSGHDADNSPPSSAEVKNE